MTSRTSDKVAQAREDLERAVAALRDSEAWKRNLRILARFHRYSINNQLLIGCQCPDASYVRGFKGWLDVGRAVRKGERGIRILAPRPWQREEPEEETGEARVEALAGISFAVVHVFDVGQTDPIPGHPNPWHPPVRHAAAGDDALAASLWSAMLTHAGTLGLTVTASEADPLVGCHTYGYYLHANRAVWIKSGRCRADMAATLAHELAHAATHDATATMDRAGREVVAESVAYAVCSLFGLDMTLRSAHYVATWLDDPEAYRAGMAAIHHGAATLIEAIEPALQAQVEGQEADELPLAA